MSPLDGGGAESVSHSTTFLSAEKLDVEGTRVPGKNLAQSSIKKT